MDQKSALQWTQPKVTVNLCPPTKNHCCTGCNQNHGHKLELKTDEQLLICENNWNIAFMTFQSYHKKFPFLDTKLSSKQPIKTCSNTFSVYLINWCLWRQERRLSNSIFTLFQLFLYINHCSSISNTEEFRLTKKTKVLFGKQLLWFHHPFM